MKERDAALLRAIEAVGGQKTLAEKLSIKSQAISQWDRVPVGRVLTIEELSGIPRTELRPDIYPPENTA